MTERSGPLTTSSMRLHYRHVVARRLHTVTHDVKSNLRMLFRNIAQPVAVVTSFMPDDHDRARFHGATLSSFTPIAMDPYPLVSFALRVPSRMAAALSSLSASSSAPAHMVVNLLSAHQSSTAVMFSRPDLHPAPFQSHDLPYWLSDEGLPVFKSVVGALSCKLVRKGIPLHDLEYLALGDPFASNPSPEHVSLDTGNVASELFIARVVRVESVEEHLSPLAYYQRGYTTCPPTR